MRLVILGEGAERPRLEQPARKIGLEGDVDLPGFVPNPYAYMARASVFVLSSVAEGFRNVVAEALACGCLVVSTDRPHGPSKILEGGRRGRLVPVGDHKAMARAIAGTLKARGREFTIEHSATKYLELLGFESAEGEGACQARRRA